MPGQDNHMYKRTLLFVIGLLVAPRALFGAELYLESGPYVHTPTAHEWYVDIMLDTEGVLMNAISLELAFDPTVLSLVSAQYDDSIVTSWFEVPKVNGDHVVLSGIMAGGFDAVIDPVSKESVPGRVARLVFTADKETETVLSFSEASLALHDGVGTQQVPKTKPFRLVLSRDSAPVQEVQSDTESPEVFTPVVAHDEALFNGKYFLVFETKDRGSGIAYYEVREGRGSWQRAVSPYEIQDQSLRKQLFVKAVDSEGNFVSVKTFDRDIYIFRYGGILGLGLIIGLVCRRLLKKPTNTTILKR